MARQTIDHHLRFGRFLDFAPQGANLGNLTFKAFRDQWWPKTVGETNERIRFGAVARLIEESSLAAPRRKQIVKPLIDEFADGKWHRADTAAKHLDTTEEHVKAILDPLTWDASRYRATAEIQKVGRSFKFSIFKQDRTISLTEIITKLTPIVDDLTFQGERAPDTVSTTTIARIAQQLRNLIDEWAE
jgi:hypothetical protein